MLLSEIIIKKISIKALYPFMISWRWLCIILVLDIIPLKKRRSEKGGLLHKPEPYPAFGEMLGNRLRRCGVSLVKNKSLY